MKKSKRQITKNNRHTNKKNRAYHVSKCLFRNNLPTNLSKRIKAQNKNKYSKKKKKKGGSFPAPWPPEVMALPRPYPGAENDIKGSIEQKILDMSVDDASSDDDLITKQENDYKSQLANIRKPNIRDERLREDRDVNVCKRHRKMIDIMCPAPGHKNKDISWESNSCLENRQFTWILNEDVKKIRKMKEFYRKCEEGRREEINLDCGKRFMNWNRHQHNDHDRYRRWMTQYKDECNEYIREIKNKISYIEAGKELLSDWSRVHPGKFKSLIIHIAYIKTQKETGAERFDKELNKMTDDEKRLMQLALYTDMTQEVADAITKNKKNPPLRDEIILENFRV